MKFSKLAAIAAVTSCMAACGGDDTPTSPTTPPAGVTTYTPATPVVGATDVFAVTRVDDSNNTISQGYTQRVASVNADGSYTLTQIDPTNASPVVNGVDYRWPASTLSFDGKGHETALSDTLGDGRTQSCTFTLQSGGHTLPWWVGQTFATTSQEDCSPGSTMTYVVDGSVVSLESVTVPAGTFMALKLQSVETFTTAAGQNVTETVTHWVDPAHSLFTLKTTIAYTRSGTVPAHYLTSQTIELQSRTSD